MEKCIAIDKEDIKNCSFVKHEVLGSKTEIDQRKKDLEKAMIFGNVEKGKVGILFETDEGIKEVETTVWASTTNNVVLKSGIVIPAHCIHKVILYRSH